MSFDKLDIVVVPRDRFSMFPRCLDALYAHTDVPFRLIVVAGGSDSTTKEYLNRFQRLKGNVRIVFTDHLLMQAEARNIGMRETRERLCVVLENDTIVHKSWLQPMLDCMREESAAAVMPLILWYRGIHAAGGRFEERINQGTVIFKHAIVYRATGRRRVDYPENHCLLIDRQQFPITDIFEDVEPFDVDLGLTARKYGLNVLVEPRSVVTYSAPPPWEIRDIALYKFRWDPTSWVQRNRRFAQKWHIEYDPGSKRASYLRQQLKLGLAGWFPTRTTIGLSNVALDVAQRILCSVMRGESWGNVPEFGPHPLER